MKRNQNFDHNHSQKVLSCRYNMDTNRAEARFEDGTTLSIDCIAIEDGYGNTRHSGRNWTGCCTISRWSMPNLCWVEKSNIIFHLVAITVDQKIDLFSQKCDWLLQNGSSKSITENPETFLNHNNSKKFPDFCFCTIAIVFSFCNSFHN